MPTREVAYRAYATCSPGVAAPNSTSNQCSRENTPTMPNRPAATSSATCTLPGSLRQKLHHARVRHLRELQVPLPHRIEGLRTGQGDDLVGLAPQSVDPFARSD